MIINLLGPLIILYPHADLGKLIMLSYLAPSDLDLCNGRVYKEISSRQHIPIEDHIITDNIIRTIIPQLGTGTFRCSHMWRKDEKDEISGFPRIIYLTVQDEMVTISETERDQKIIAIDLQLLEFETNSKTKTLWDHLSE